MINQDLINTINRRRADDPIRSYLWIADLPRIGDTSLHREVSGRILAVSTPFYTISGEKQSRGNSVWNYAKSDEMGNLSMEVMECEDCLTFQYFDSWIRLIKNPNHTYNPPVHYKKDFIFYRLDSFKSKIEKFTYKGFFPSGFSDQANDYETNNILKYTIQFIGDDMIHETMASTATNKDLYSIYQNARTTKTPSAIEYLF